MKKNSPPPPPTPQQRYQRERDIILGRYLLRMLTPRLLHHRTHLTEFQTTIRAYLR